MTPQAITQVLTILLMFALTYVGFLALGPARKNLAFTKQEKHEWDTLMRSKLGSWFALTSIVGTLTSLATVYVFFIGSAQLFGLWTFFCCITIWGGAWITNFFTQRLCRSPHVQSLLTSPDQVGGVVATLFWSNDPTAVRVSRVIKLVSLVSIAGVIWLEFALFSDIAGRALGLTDLLSRGTLLFLCSLAVFYFTLRYGLRGFVFADAFQSPLILFSTIALLAGAFWVAAKSHVHLSLPAIASPILPISTCLIFASHVLILNLFLVLVTEPHWLRLWIFREKEVRLQPASTAGTAILWALLIAVGYVAYATTGKTGEDAIIGLLEHFQIASPILPALFWVGGVAALFSTADSQIYSFIVVNAFRPRTGTLNPHALTAPHAFLSSTIAASVFLIFYVFFRYFGIPFEKLVFAIVPFSLNILPAIALTAFSRRPRVLYILISTALYIAATVAGFMRAEHNLAWTLAAASAPVFVAIIASCIEPKIDNETD